MLSIREVAGGQREQVQSLAKELRSLKPQETTTKENNKTVREKMEKNFRIQD